MLAALLAGAGCDMKPKGPVGPSMTEGVPGIDTRQAVFGPRSVEVHPLTRIVRDPETGAASIEVHLELLDQWGGSVRGFVRGAVSLYREAGPAEGASQLKRWNIDLTNLEENVEGYDRVTRTYRMRLVGVPSEADRSGQLELQVVLTTLDDRRLTASRRLD